MIDTDGRYHRITEWWRPKAGTIFSVLLFYLAIWAVPFSHAWKLLLFSIITLTGFGLTGYFLNDWADIPFDRKVGKTNLVSGIPVFLRPLIFIGLLAITLIPWLVFFETNVFSFILIGSQFALQFAYPIPPIRLKNYAIPAMLTDALYAFGIPSILAWHTFDLTAGFNSNQGEFAHLILLGGWMLLMGIRHIINHHVTDSHNDLKTGTSNLANKISPLALRKIVHRFLYPLEFTFSIGFFLELYHYIGWMSIVMVGFAFLFGIRPMIYGVSFSKLEMDRFAAFFLGLAALLILCAGELEYLAILMLFIALFTDSTRHPFFKHTVSKFLELIFKKPLKLASVIVNWSVFYVRKFLLGWSDERNFGLHYPDHVARMEIKEKKKRGVVAIFNQNQNKYTETFVRGHVEKLPFHVVYFHGWPSPTFVNEMESLISENNSMVKLKYNIAKVLNLNVREIENRYIQNRLLAEKVDVILAEFGTMGSRVTTVAQNTGIPLVPIFYGYDAWHQKALAENKADYSSMFEVATEVLGVSKDICQQLVNLGCPEVKVDYLPCYVDLNRFSYVERDFSEPIFLAIGRFCATKAPFITILAFSKVLEKLPNAKLTIIGGDENGVLETCLSLIRSLGIEEHVTIPGTQTSDEIMDHMRKASIFVQHSVTTPQTGDKEGTPVAIMEAMASGLPIISTKHAGIAEVIENGVSGVLVNEFDVEGMTKEMIQLFNDKDRMRKMSRAASAAILENNLITDHIKILTSKLEKHIVR